MQSMIQSQDTSRSLVVQLRTILGTTFVDGPIVWGGIYTQCTTSSLAIAVSLSANVDDNNRAKIVCFDLIDDGQNNLTLTSPPALIAENSLGHIVGFLLLRFHSVQIHSNMVIFIVPPN